MYNAGRGQGAFDADEAAIGRAALLEVQALFFHPPVAQFTKKNYPHEPLYLLYQNQQMADGMSNQARKELAMARYARAKTAKVGDKIVCPGCGTEMVKASYQHVYCKDKVRGRSTCKDFINNWFDPARMARAIDAWNAKYGARH